MENNSPYYFAIDSDILRSLTFIDILLEKDSNAILSSIDDPLISKWGGYLKRLYQKIKSDEIRPVIVETVYLENKHSHRLIEFMKKYCYFPNVNYVNYQLQKEKTKKLAYAYCEPYMFRGEMKPAPMQKKYNAALGEYTPINDCFIMAQATICGVPLITANGKDFIFDENNENENQIRVLGIASINHSQGYHDTLNNKSVTAVPIHIRTIGPMLKDKSLFFETMKPIGTFDKGSDIIEDDPLLDI